MLDVYHNFFAASCGASAAFIGLLFVALSFIDNQKTDAKAVAWRRIIANSSFSQLVNIFFVSLTGLLPDARNFAITGCVVAVLGLIASIRLLSPTIDLERTGRTAPTFLGLAAVAVYVLEFMTSLGVLNNPNSQQSLNLFILAIILLYAGALARAWEITGVKGR